ncbi:hypothetical protein ES703_05397 [subsurface metagenome]
MPIYEEEGRVTREELLDLSKRNQCKECGEPLAVFIDMDSGKAFLACNDWRRSHHEGIEREASRYEMEGLASLNIPTRREIMTQDYGEVKTRALEKSRLPMTGALTKPQAMDILKLVYPDVPEDEIVRTAILCRDFGLHPLMKEVYILGFKNSRTGKTDYSTVIGISASRKMAADRKGAYSFLDGTPRVATSAEIIKQFGKDSEEERDNLISICCLKGEKGNEATGFGLWPKNKEPYGTDKGNTKRNMANIRSERPAYNRLPGEALPQIEVIDEAYAQVPDIGKVDTITGEIVEGEAREIKDTEAPKEHWCAEHNCAFELKKSRFGSFYAHKIKGGWCNEKKKDEASKEETGEPEPEPEPTKPERDPSTIKTLNELYKACNEDFKIQPDQVVKELGVSSQTDISDTPEECYRKIAAVR